MNSHPRKFRWLVISTKVVLALTTLALFGLISYVAYWNFVFPNNYVYFVDNSPIIFQPQNESFPEKKTLRIINYNLGWAVGNYQETLAETTTEEKYRYNLDQFIKVVKELDAEILLLQEVDLFSERSHYLNQVEYLQNELKWKYAAITINWNIYTPIEGTWRTKYCSAVLSKYPINKNQSKHFIFKLNLTNPIKRLFYYPFLWSAPVQYVEISWNGKKINIFNCHFSITSRKNRKMQWEDTLDWITNFGLQKNLIIGGDFNFQATAHKEKFSFRDKSDFANHPPFFKEVWNRIPNIQEVFITPNNTNEEINQIVTFPEQHQRLDFLFFSKDFNKISSRVINDLFSSDHFPIFCEFSYRDSQNDTSSPPERKGFSNFDNKSTHQKGAVDKKSSTDPATNLASETLDSL